MDFNDLFFYQYPTFRVQNDLKGIFSRRSGDKKKPPAKPIVYSLIDLELRNDDNKVRFDDLALTYCVTHCIALHSILGKNLFSPP